MSNTAKLLQTATTHHKAGRYADAEKAYQILLQQEANAEAARLLGALYLQTGRADKAVETLEQAVRLASNPGPPDPETLTNLGVALRTVGRHREALDRYRQALAQRPITALRSTIWAPCCMNRGGYPKPSRSMPMCCGSTPICPPRITISRTACLWPGAAPTPSRGTSMR